MRPVLVTAGATRNPIDAMRFVSANSSGRTSVAVARRLAELGCNVHLLGSPEANLRAGGLSCQEFSTTRDLMRRMQAWITDHPRCAVVHAAAVGDYEAAAEDAGKIASNLDELVIRLRPTPKIADHIKGWAPESYLVTFKAAAPGTGAEVLVDTCRAQLLKTRSDLVLGNVLGELCSTTTLVDESGSEAFEDRAAALKALSARVASA